MPGNAVPYRDWKVIRFHHWLKRLTLWEYALFTAVYILLIATFVMTLIWWSVPHSWLPQPPLAFALAFVAGFTVLWAAWHTRQRRTALRQNKDGLR